MYDRCVNGDPLSAFDFKELDQSKAFKYPIESYIDQQNCWALYVEGRVNVHNLLEILKKCNELGDVSEAAMPIEISEENRRKVVWMCDFLVNNGLLGRHERKKCTITNKRKQHLARARRIRGGELLVEDCKLDAT